jgi:hypothetical protein
MSSNGNNGSHGFGAQITRSIKNAAVNAYRAVKKRVEGPKASFEGGGVPIEVQFDLAGGTVWATQQQMADLFGVERSVITKHVQNVFSDKELEQGPATCAIFAQVRMEGDREVTRDVEHYSLEVVMAVGYRVSSAKAIQFRAWATDKLSAYVRDGFVLNEQRLRNDPVAVQSLAEKVRDLRFDEKNLYARVRDCVVMVASDYDGSSEQVRSFFARMQDKFHYAACEKTAQQIVLTRADGTKERMGMTTQLNNKPTLADARVAKNYLSESELKLQMLAGDAFFIFVENMIVRGRTMTTAQLLAKIDEVFKFHEMPEFPGYVGPYLKPQADAHVKKQYDLFKHRTAQERYDEARGLPRR